MFWDKGFEAAPDLVKYSRESWEILNPDWQLEFLDADAADCIVRRADFPETLIAAHYADILRTKIMSQIGGVWADATLLCMARLDQWLSPLFNQCGFFAFYRPGRNRLISNWFLASVPGSIVASRWSKEVERYWQEKRRKPPPYFWHHHLFEYLVRNDRAFRQAWTQTPKISAEPPHLVQKHLGVGALDACELEWIRCTMVQKLSYKMAFGVEDVSGLLADLGCGHSGSPIGVRSPE